MKRFSVVVILIFAAALAFSQNATTIGASYWRATPEVKAGQFSDLDVSDGNMFGPYLNFRTGKLVLGGSLYVGNFEMSQDWDFGDLSSKMEFTLKRSDINVTAGYSLSNALTVFGAMKHFNSKLTDFQVNDLDIIDTDIDAEYGGNLFGGGLSGVANMGQSSFFLFGSAAYLAGTLEFEFKSGSSDYYGYYYDDEEDSKTEQDVKLTSATLGAGYRLSPNLNLLVGYRVDSLIGEENEDNEKTEEKYNGITVSLGYTMR
jgi:hypothetical protein